LIATCSVYAQSSSAQAVVIKEAGDFLVLNVPTMRVTAAWNLARVSGLEPAFGKGSKPIIAAMKYEPKRRLLFVVHADSASSTTENYRLTELQLPHFDLVDSSDLGPSDLASPVILINGEGNNIWIDTEHSEEKIAINQVRVLKAGKLEEVRSFQEKQPLGHLTTKIPPTSGLIGDAVLRNGFTVSTLQVQGAQLVPRAESFKLVGNIVNGHGLELLSNHENHWTVALTDFATGTKSPQFDVPVGIAALTDDGKHVLVEETSSTGTLQSFNGVISWFDAEQGKLLSSVNEPQLAGSTQFNRSLCSSPDGTYMLYQGRKSWLVDMNEKKVKQLDESFGLNAGCIFIASDMSK
jgi:hypothetical protein